MNLYEKILTAFNKSKIEYLIVGGIAVTLYGVDRTTKDLDIWVNNSNENLQKLEKAFISLNFSKEGAKEALLRLSKNEVIIIPDKSGEVFRIDLISYYSSFLDFESAFERKSTFSMGTFDSFVISKNDLINTKIASGREKDLLDAKFLRDLDE